jgi:hypothetical protein
MTSCHNTSIFDIVSKNILFGGGAFKGEQIDDARINNR